MATAARSRIDVAIQALHMKSSQMPPAKATGLTLPETCSRRLGGGGQCQF
jgi:hypothetical protein